MSVKSGPEFGSDGVMKWERVERPLWWPAARAHIVADRHLPDGTRQHMLDVDVQVGAVLCGAQLVGRDSVQSAEFSSRSSHLSAVSHG